MLLHVYTCTYVFVHRVLWVTHSAINDFNQRLINTERKLWGEGKEESLKQGNYFDHTVTYTHTHTCSFVCIHTFENVYNICTSRFLMVVHCNNFRYLSLFIFVHGQSVLWKELSMQVYIIICMYMYMYIQVDPQVSISLPLPLPLSLDLSFSHTVVLYMVVLYMYTYVGDCSWSCIHTCTYMCRYPSRQWNDSTLPRDSHQH